MNKMLMTDSYKLSHYSVFNPDVEYMHYYIEARCGKWNRTLFFGLQMILEDYFSKQFTVDELKEANDIAELHGVPFPYDEWKYIIDEYNGYLPLRIDAVEEGSVIPTSNILVSVTNTDPKCYWLPSYIETVLLRAVWYPTTVATQGFYIKRLLLDFLKETGTPELVDFKLHDFGARSSKSSEAAAIGGCAHLVNFKGTDTLEGLMYANKYYSAGVSGFSIPALEHSVVMSYGRDNERHAYEMFLSRYSRNIRAMVVDTYDLYSAIENIVGNDLKDMIINDSGHTVVIRPDSGNPVATSTNTINKLMDKFGFYVNEKGYKVLPDYIRVIHGDGISYQSIQDIIFEMKAQKLSGDNIAFGMGSKLLDQLDRDNLSFAMKNCANVLNNKTVMHVRKDPKTDNNKRSKAGILSLIKDEHGNYKTLENMDYIHSKDLLETVFENGKIVKRYSLSDIRNKVNESL